jgi:hypothetical protein
MDAGRASGGALSLVNAAPYRRGFNVARPLIFAPAKMCAASRLPTPAAVLLQQALRAPDVSL